MKEAMPKLAGILGTVLMLGLAGPAQAADWNELDSDNSGDLTQDEWDAGYNDEEIYEEWDANDDGILDDNEYSAGLYDQYDQNDDGVWDEQEYGTWYDDAGDEGFWDA